ncbi:hypothetical protein KKB18_07320 [bacterium]|nr:hypothetical protein [bacterium]
MSTSVKSLFSVLTRKWDGKLPYNNKIEQANKGYLIKSIVDFKISRYEIMDVKKKSKKIRICFILKFIDNRTFLVVLDKKVIRIAKARIIIRYLNLKDI